MAGLKRRDKRERRIFPLRVKLTATEQTAIRDVAKDRSVTISQYVRELVLAKTKAAIAVTRPSDPHKRELINALAALGNNVNQIARELNTTGVLAEEDHRYLAELSDVIKRAIVKGLEL